MMNLDLPVSLKGLHRIRRRPFQVNTGASLSECHFVQESRGMLPPPRSCNGHLLKAQQLEGLRPHIQQIVPVDDHIGYHVPEGYQQAFLEGKPRFCQAQAKAILYTNGQVSFSLFELKPSRDNEWLRIKAARMIWMLKIPVLMNLWRLRRKRYHCQCHSNRRGGRC